MLTALDEEVALICVDLQAGILRMPVNRDTAELAARAGTLATAFRAHDKSIVAVTVGGSPPGRTERGPQAVDLSDDFTTPSPALNVGPPDIEVRKTAWGALTGTDLQQRLTERGTRQLVICGISTSIGVESTARAAFDLGYHVVIATDLIADTSPEAHANSLERIFPRMAELATSRDLLSALRAHAGIRHISN